jgi:hypothetical protein
MPNEGGFEIRPYKGGVTIQKFRLPKIATHARKRNLRKLCNEPGRTPRRAFCVARPCARSPDELGRAQRGRERHPGARLEQSRMSRAIEACVNGAIPSSARSSGLRLEGSPCTRPRSPVPPLLRLPVRPLLFSAELLISQTFLEIFALAPPLQGFTGEVHPSTETRKLGTCSRSSHP